MAKKHCMVCDAEYDYCPNCEKTKAWKSIGCCPEHYQVHMTLENLRQGIFTKDEAVDSLKNACGITNETDLSYMIPEVEQCIRAEIIGYKSIKKKNK